MTGRVLGLDGGGSKTMALVVNRSGDVLAHTNDTGLDPTAGPDWEMRLRAIAGRIGPVDAAVLGLPYHTEIAAVSARQTQLGTALFGPACSVVNDVAVAFEGALAGQDGVLILSGTGSMSWARGPAGVVRVGGWGDVFGDEGSAYWIGREALTLVSRHLDGRQSCADFALSILHQLGVPPDGLIAWTYGHINPRVQIAVIAETVSKLADRGNPQAGALLHRAANQLAELGRTAARLIGAKSPLIWSFAGGVTQDQTLCRALTDTMGCPPVPARLPPVGGAVLLAAQSAGWSTDDAFIARLAANLTAILPPQTQTA